MTHSLKNSITNNQGSYFARKKIINNLLVFNHTISFSAYTLSLHRICNKTKQKIYIYSCMI